MKKTALLLALLAIIIPSTLYAKKDVEDKVKIMSFNLRNGDSGDGTNAWSLRYAFTAMMIDDIKPDVIGVQEALDYQLSYYPEVLNSYKYVGKGRDDGKKKGEYTAFLYNTKTTSVVKWGMFWLSENPDKPGEGWDATANRTCTWAIMKDKKSGNQYCVVNTHLDEVGVLSRHNGVSLILSRLAEINKDGLPVLFMGCFNVSQDDICLADIESQMKNCRKSAVKTDDGITYNAWGKTQQQSQIDHVYYSGFDRCDEFSVLTKKYENRSFLSDHFPVIAVMVF